MLTLLMMVVTLRRRMTHTTTLDDSVFQTAWQLLASDYQGYQYDNIHTYMLMLLRWMHRNRNVTTINITANTQ